MNRRQFLGASAALGVVPARAEAKSRVAPHWLEEITIAEIQAGFAAGRFTSRALTMQYLERIRALDKAGPRVNAVIEINPDALSIASALDRERRAKRPRGPLHGVPVLIKDNIDTADRMSTSAGSLALAANHAARDSFVAQKLRAAGAVILAKSNLSEWANYRSLHSVSGWSGRGGQTRNPYALDRNPCGSSSGTGAGVSANFCAVGVGTETDGSVVCPSSINGIVGIKPTLGLISRAGIIPIAHSQDTAGPMARTVRDAAILLSVLAGVDERDPATAASAAHVQPDYTQFLDAGGMRGARVGIARKFFGISAEVDELMENAIAVLKQNGAEVIDPADLPTFGKFGDAENEVLAYEFKAGLNAYLAGVPASVPVHSLDDVIAFNKSHATAEMPWFRQEIMLDAAKRGPLTDPAYLAALSSSKRMAGPDGIDAALQKDKLDAILAPTAGPGWLTDLITGDHDPGGCSQPPAVAGYPHITVPAGFVHGLPVGVSFFSTAWSEPALLKLAYAFEQATRLRKPPRFLATANLTA